MMLIGCDYHPSWQQISWLDMATGETGEKKLEHASGEAEKFYRGLPGPALIGMESTGNCSGLWRWPRRPGMMFGSGMRQRFAPATCGNRSTTGEMPR